MKGKESRGLSASIALAILISAASVSSATAQIKITSDDFQSGGNLPLKFTCDGSGTNPALRISGAPATAKSLVLVVDDPDAPSGLFTHWLVWNIDPKMTSIGEGSSPAGTLGRNDFGQQRFGAPCPPSGTHRYFFKIFALDCRLNLGGGENRAQLDAAMKGHVLMEGQLMARYSRRK